MANTLFDKAVSNLNTAIAVKAIAASDEEQLNIAGYHLQQSLELAIKYTLEQNGIEYPKTHDIEQLILLAKNNKVDLHLGEYIEEHSEMFSQWESKSRYILGYLIEEKKIDAAIKAVDEYLKGLASK